MTLRSAMFYGALAGTAGTVALNLCAYLDMALTRRPPSAVPSLAARALAERLGFSSAPSANERERNRWEGWGEALGLVHGTLAGVGYGAVRATVLPSPSWKVAATALAFETFAAGEGAATALGATEPKNWGFAGTLRGLILRLAYGFVTAAAFETLRTISDGNRGGRHIFFGRGR